MSKSRDTSAGTPNDPGLVVPGADQLSPLLSTALDNQRPEIRRGVLDVVDRKRGQSTPWK